MPLFDTKYLALEMKQYLFTRQARPTASTYVENLSSATSLSSLYALLTSKFYDSLIFFKPTFQIDSALRSDEKIQVQPMDLVSIELTEVLRLET